MPGLAEHLPDTTKTSNATADKSLQPTGETPHRTAVLRTTVHSRTALNEAVERILSDCRGIEAAHGAAGLPGRIEIRTIGCDRHGSPHETVWSLQRTATGHAWGVGTGAIGADYIRTIDRQGGNDDAWTTTAIAESLARHGPLSYKSAHVFPNTFEHEVMSKAEAADDIWGRRAARLIGGYDRRATDHQLTLTLRLPATGRERADDNDVPREVIELTARVTERDAEGRPKRVTLAVHPESPVTAGDVARRCRQDLGVQPGDGEITLDGRGCLTEAIARMRWTATSIMPSEQPAGTRERMLRGVIADLIVKLRADNWTDLVPDGSDGVDVARGEHTTAADDAEAAVERISRLDETPGEARAQIRPPAPGERPGAEDGDAMRRYLDDRGNPPKR